MEGNKSTVKNRAKRSRKENFVRLFAALLVLCLIGFAGTFLAEAIAKQQSGWIETQGVILRRETEDYWDVNLEIISRRYRYQVGYKTRQGESVAAETTTETPYAEEGAAVDIRYDPDEPASITFSESLTSGDVIFLNVARYALLGLAVICGMLIRHYRHGEKKNKAAVPNRSAHSPR